MSAKKYDDVAIFFDKSRQRYGRKWWCYRYGVALADQAEWRILYPSQPHYSGRGGGFAGCRIAVKWWLALDSQGGRCLLSHHYGGAWAYHRLTLGGHKSSDKDECCSTRNLGRGYCQGVGLGDSGRTAREDALCSARGYTKGA